MDPQTPVAVALACLASAVPLLGLCVWYMRLLHNRLIGLPCRLGHAQDVIPPA